MNKYITIVLVLLLTSTTFSMINVGEPAPDFELQDINGKSFKLSNCSDYIVLLVFMGYNCSICKAEAPEIEKLNKKWIESGVKFIGIDIWDGIPSSLDAQFVKATGSTYNFVTYGSAVGMRYGMSISNYVIVGTDGNIKYIGYSYNESELESQFSSLVSNPDQKPKVVPESFYLEQNYPNPFNPETQIDYEIRTEVPTEVELIVFDLLGKTVKILVNETKPSGFYSAKWDGTNQAGIPMPSGFYFYMLKTRNHSEIKKMLLQK